MVAQDYDAEADAVYVKLASRKVARTVEVDSGTLADVDANGRLVGVEVIHPDRAWPLDDIISRFDVPDEQALELRREYERFRKTGRRHGGASAAAVIVGAGAVGTGIAVVWRILRRILSPVR